MSAKVKPAQYCGWVAICADCNYASLTGPAYMVDLWADVHNDNNHREERDA